MTSASSRLKAGMTSSTTFVPSAVRATSTRRRSSGMALRLTRPLRSRVSSTPERVPPEIPASAASLRDSWEPQIRSTKSTTKALHDSRWLRSTSRSIWFRITVAVRNTFDTAANDRRSRSRPTIRSRIRRSASINSSSPSEKARGIYRHYYSAPNDLVSGLPGKTSRWQ